VQVLHLHLRKLYLLGPGTRKEKSGPGRIEVENLNLPEGKMYV